MAPYCEFTDTIYRVRQKQSGIPYRLFETYGENYGSGATSANELVSGENQWSIRDKTNVFKDVGLTWPSTYYGTLDYSVITDKVMDRQGRGSTFFQSVNTYGLNLRPFFSDDWAQEQSTPRYFVNISMFYCPIVLGSPIYFNRYQNSQYTDFNINTLAVPNRVPKKCKLNGQDLFYRQLVLEDTLTTTPNPYRETGSSTFQVYKDAPYTIVSDTSTYDYQQDSFFMTEAPEVGDLLYILYHTQSDWAQSTTYAVGDTRTSSQQTDREYSVYRCLVAHTSSSDFDADIAAGYWEDIQDNLRAIIADPTSAPTSVVHEDDYTGGPVYGVIYRIDSGLTGKLDFSITLSGSPSMFNAISKAHENRAYRYLEENSFMVNGDKQDGLYLD